MQLFGVKEKWNDIKIINTKIQEREKETWNKKKKMVDTNLYVLEIILIINELNNPVKRVVYLTLKQNTSRYCFQATDLKHKSIKGWKQENGKWHAI